MELNRERRLINFLPLRSGGGGGLDSLEGWGLFEKGA